LDGSAGVLQADELVLAFYGNPSPPAAAVNHKSFLGIFPEIDRVWATIDNKLFLWDYQERCVAGARVARSICSVPAASSG
jgi:hypothetical protein